MLVKAQVEAQLLRRTLKFGTVHSWDHSVIKMSFYYLFFVVVACVDEPKCTGHAWHCFILIVRMIFDAHWKRASENRWLLAFCAFQITSNCVDNSTLIKLRDSTHNSVEQSLRCEWRLIREMRHTNYLGMLWMPLMSSIEYSNWVTNCVFETKFNGDHSIELCF